MVLHGIAWYSISQSWVALILWAKAPATSLVTVKVPWGPRLVLVKIEQKTWGEHSRRRWCSICGAAECCCSPAFEDTCIIKKVSFVLFYCRFPSEFRLNLSSPRALLNVFLLLPARPRLSRARSHLQHCNIEQVEDSVKSIFLGWWVLLEPYIYYNIFISPAFPDLYPLSADNICPLDPGSSENIGITLFCQINVTILLDPVRSC